MTPTETTTILRQFNEWRRVPSDGWREHPTSKEITEAIDAAVEIIERLEDAESDALEQARLNGMGASREATLMAKLEAAEKERDNANAAAVNIALEAERLQCENDALRAKIEAMENQEPVAYLPLSSARMLESGVIASGVVWNCRDKAASDIPLYARPGARLGPEDVMRDAERYRYLRARDDGTAGVGCWLEAKGRVCDRGWLYGAQLDSAIDSFIELLAAAPEAKP